MIDVRMKTISHNQQRYDTSGDYYEFNDAEHILVSRLDNDHYEFLVGLHELIEWFLTREAGIPEEAISQFDTEFKGKGEPGDSKKAPYRAQHQFATKIEKLVAAELGVDWNAYDKAVQSLSWKNHRAR